MDYLYYDEMHKFFIEQQIPDQDHIHSCLEMLNYITVGEVVGFIRNQENLPKIEAKNIPQFSSLSAIDGVLDIVNSSENITYDEIGYYFFHDSGIVAQRKYGENHYKLSSLLGLVTWEKPFRITELGKEYMLMDKENKENIRNILIMRIPIIQRIMSQVFDERIRTIDLLGEYLADSTAKRRQSNVHALIDIVINSMDKELQFEIIDNLNWK